MCGFPAKHVSEADFSVEYAVVAAVPTTVAATAAAAIEKSTKFFLKKKNIDLQIKYRD